MRRSLEVHHPVPGDVDTARGAFGGDPSGWLPSPARWQGTGRWNVRLEAGRLSRLVVCQVGAPWHVGEERWRLLGWEPVGQPGDPLPLGRALPAFTGELGLLEDGGRAVLALRGAYRPPAGPLGAAADAAGLRRVAEATGTQFLAGVATRLGACGAGGGDAGDRD